MIRFLALLLGLGAVPASAPAVADTAAHQLRLCSEAQMGVARALPAQSVREFEVIVDGFIEAYRPPPRAGDVPGLAIVRVDKVWKGEVTPRIAVPTWMPSIVGEWSGQLLLPPPNCSNPVRAGVQVRIAALIAGKTGEARAVFPDIDGSMDVLSGDLSELREPKLDPLLAA
jgi:hypothetical protein